MPRFEAVLRTFVASPNDVEEERDVLEEIIKELNSTWSKQLGLRFDLVRWETEGFPGVGDEPQAVLNEQIGDDYDLFIGILWKHFGTPTKTAASGTEEEFRRAHQRYLNNPDSVKIMFYFKDTPTPPSEIDPSQLALVHKFRQELGEKGVLYWPYKDKSEFEQLVRMHLGRQAQDWKKRLERKQASSQQSSFHEAANETQAIASELEIRPENGEGLLDLTESIYDDIKVLNATMARMTKATQDLGVRTEKRTQDLLKFKPAFTPQKVKRAKELINRTAADLGLFVTQMTADIPTFSETYSRLIDQLTKALEIHKGFGEGSNESSESYAEVISHAKELVHQFDLNKNGIAGFRSSIVSLPRLSTELNRAKRKAEKVLDSLILEFEKAIDLTSELIKSQ